MQYPLLSVYRRGGDFVIFSDSVIQTPGEAIDVGETGLRGRSDNVGLLYAGEEQRCYVYTLLGCLISIWLELFLVSYRR